MKAPAKWRGDNPTNHFPNMTGENYKLGSGARGLTSQSQQIMKAFLLDQKEGLLGRKTGGEEGRWKKGDGCWGGGLVPRRHTHRPHLKPLVPRFSRPADDGEYPGWLTDISIA